MLRRILPILVVFANPVLAPAKPAPLDDALAPLKALEQNGARVGAVFEAGGKVVASFHPDDLLNPASVSKVFTAALALDVLGADRTFEATVRVVGAEGPVDLYVAGHGDPSLTSADLKALAECVRDTGGVSQVARLLIELEPFDTSSVPPAFDTKSGDPAYRAGVAGFQVDLNALQVTVRPGAKGESPLVAVAPASPYVRVLNQAVTAGGKAKKGKGQKPGRLAIATGEEGGRVVVRVTGVVPLKGVTTVFRRIPDPAMNAGFVFRAALEAAGVKVERGPAIGGGPAGAREVCRHASPPLRDILNPMLKESLNPVAESLLRLAGAAGAKGLVGFDEGGRALATFLKTRVALPGASFHFANGSGLFDANTASARAVVALLKWVRREAGEAPLIDALPVAAVDGTLKGRFKKTPLAGKVRAKTGTLDDAVALAGYAELPDGRDLTFAILVGAPKCDADRAAGCGHLDAHAARKALDDVVLGVWQAEQGRQPTADGQRLRGPAR